MSTGILQSANATGAGVKDYERRLSDLTSFAAVEYGISPMELTIIAACLVPTDKSNPCWLCVDSTRNYLWIAIKEYLSGSSYGRMDSINRIREMRPRYANREVGQLIGSRFMPTIYTDRNFEKANVGVHARSLYPDLETECVRLRVNLDWKAAPGKEVEGEFLRLLGLAVDAEHRRFKPSAYRPVPETVKTAVDLIARANLGISDPQSMLRNLLILVSAVAVVHGRRDAVREDWWAVNRVVLDTIRPWTRRILQVFADHDGHQTIVGLEIATGLPRKLIVAECARLHDAGVLRWPGPVGRGNRARWLRLASGVGDDMGRLLRGEWEWV